MSMRRSLFWTGLGQLVLFGSQLGSQIVVSRELSPYLVGIAVLAFSITDIINVMAAFGLRNFLVREKELCAQQIRTAFTINIILSLITSGAVLAVAYWAAAAYDEAGVAHVLHVAALVPLVLAFELVPNALLQREMRFGYLAISNAAKAFTTAAVTITMVLMGFSYMSIGYGAVAGATVGALLASFLSKSTMRWGVGFYDWKRISSFGLHMFGITGINTVSSRAIDLVIGKMLGLGELALYSRASSLNNLLWTNIHSVVARVVFSSMAEEMRTTGSLRSIYVKTVQVITATLWPAFAGLAVFSGPLIRVMYGDQWISAAPILSLFALAALGLTSITMTWEVFVIREKTGEQARRETVRSILTLAATVIGATINLVGAAFGRIADAIFAILIYRKPLSRYTEAPLSEIFGIFKRSALVTIVAILPGLALMFSTGWSAHTPFGLVAASTFMGIVFWIIAIKYGYPILYDEIRTTLRAVFNRRGRLR